MPIEDGVDLPPEIGFDIEDIQLPTPEKFSTIFPDASNVVIRYLEAFYNFFDSDDRQPLLDAYADKALLSIMAGYPKYLRGEPLTGWLQFSRNCSKIDGLKMKQNLKRGKLNVVGLLNELPKTEHDSSSFTMDVIFATDQMIVFSLTGLFKETKTQHRPVRYFSRTGILGPLNQGWVLVNDMWSVSLATGEQHKAFISKATANNPLVNAPAAAPVLINAPAGQVPVQPVPAVAPVPIQPVVQTGAGLTPDLKKAMIEQFSNQSGMNLAFSQRCLEENNWDYPKAGERFWTLKTANQIPAEAFVK